MNISKHQQGITQDLPPVAYYLFFNLKSDRFDLAQTIENLKRLADGLHCVVGFGQGLMHYADSAIPYHPYTAEGKAKKLSSAANYDLALWLRSDDAGICFHQARQLVDILCVNFDCCHIIRGFTYLAKHDTSGEKDSHDLSGFIDGTENPKGDEIIDIAIIDEKIKGLTGGSFWTLQQWQHKFDWLDGASNRQKEAAIGRSLDDNEELENADQSAHIKRTEQERFDPEATIWRRSMDWADDSLNGGLMFSSFAASFYPFEIQLNAMVGNEDGIIDGVFKFSQILHTSHFFCPPFVKGKLDLSLFNF
ncbi:MAG: Dyp-type peroxidase [Francisellaceae bacterium]